MQMKILVSRVGDRFSQVPGDVAEIEPDAEAFSLWRHGHAVPVDGKVPAEWKKRLDKIEKQAAKETTPVEPTESDPDGDALK